MVVEYLPYDKRRPDDQYRSKLVKTLWWGRDVERQQSKDVDEETHQRAIAREWIGGEMWFELANGFPLITERDLLALGRDGHSQFEQGLGELCAFLNGAQTIEELEQFGVRWWKRWASPRKTAKRGLPPGDLGPGSYGAAWRRFPTSEGEPFDQIQNIIEQIKESPHLRTHYITPFIPQYTIRGEGKQQKVVVVPCHGMVHINLFPETKELELVMWQRSIDWPVGAVFNMIQYPALAMILGQLTGYRPVAYVHQVSNGHIYHGQIDDVMKLISTPVQRLPTVTLDPSVTSIYELRPRHFTVEDYHPRLGRMVIWTPE